MGKSASEVRADIEDTRRDMSDTVDAIADRASPRRIVHRRRERVAAGWRSVRDRVMGKAESTYGTAADQAGRLPEAAGEAATTMKETAQAVPRKVVEETQGNPIAAGIVAFGAGLLIASVLPPSEAEQRAAAQLRDKAGPLQDELGQAGRQVVEDVKSAAQDGVQQVKNTASDAAANVQEDVRSSAQQVSEQAHD
jgi:hypothetical protein